MMYTSYFSCPLLKNNNEIIAVSIARITPKWFWGPSLIEVAPSYNLLKIDGILVYETDEVEVIPDTIGMYERFNDKKYGRNVLNFYKRKE